MKSLKSSLLSGTVVPLAIGAGVALGGATLAKSPNAPAKPKPAALKQIAQCGAKKKGCNPCAAKKGCGPCGAAKKGCNPCGACSPCGGAATAVSKRCVIKRLQAANPCAAKKGCNPCNPCGPKKAACNPCNPCAAKKGCNPCNPCAAKKGCNPCNPCAATKDAVKLTPAEARSAYNCLKREMVAAYAKSGDAVAKWYGKYRRYNKQAYVSATHGQRYVNNYANKTARKYGKYEKAGIMPTGSVLAKDSFSVTANGRLSVGPLFIMTKMKSGFNKASANWQYKMIMPNGQVFGVTKGKGSAKVQFCVTCHAGAEVDQMLFLPDEVRRK